MAYNPFDDEVDNDPAYQGIDEDPRTKALDITLNIPMRRPLTPPVPKFISEGRGIRRKQDQLERINNLKFPSSAYQKAAETLPPPEGEELDKYNDQFFTRKRFPGVSVAEVGEKVYDFLGKGTGPEVQEQMDLNKEILKRNTYQLDPNVKPGSIEALRLKTKYEQEIMKSLKEQGYDDINIGRVLQNFFLGDQKQAYDAMGEGTAYSDLPDPLKSGANPFWLLLDSVDALTLGAGGLLLAGAKLTPKFINFLKNAKRSKMADVDIITQAKQQFPDEYATIVTSNNNALEQAGIPVPQILRRQADMPGGSPGVPSLDKESRISEYNKVLKDIEDGKISNDLTYQGLMDLDYFKDFKKADGRPLNKDELRATINKDSKTNNITAAQSLQDRNKIKGEKRIGYNNQIIEFLSQQPTPLGVGETVELLKKNNLSASSPLLKKLFGMEETKLGSIDYKFNPNTLKKARGNVIFQQDHINKINSILSVPKQLKKYEGLGAPEVARQLNVPISTLNKWLAKNKNIRKKINIKRKTSGRDDAMFSKYITSLNKTKDNASKIPNSELDRSFLYNEYRGTTGYDKNLTPEKFFNKDEGYYDPNFKNTSEYESFVKLEGERKVYTEKLQKGIKDLIESNPKYKKYLLRNDLERQFGGQKAHSFFMAEVAKMGSKGRLQGLGNNPEHLFLTSGVTNNKTQRIFDRIAVQVNDIFLNPQNKNLTQPLRDTLRTNSESRDIVNRALENLKDYGYTKTKQDFLKERATLGDTLSYIRKSIDKMYRDRQIGLVTPLTKRTGKRGAPTKGANVIGLDTTALLGPKEIPDLDKSVSFHVNRYKELLDKAIAEGKKKLPRGKGKSGDQFIKGLAVGGTVEDYTQNVDLMSDRFMKDPGFEEEDAFAKSLEGATAFNPFNIFKVFKKTPGVATPKNVNEVNLYNQLVDTQNMGGADVGIETLVPTVKSVNDNDFAFKSFTIDKLNSANAPKNATPEAWRQFLKGGELKAPESELLDSGMEDFFIDSEKMFPGGKISKEQLIDIYNESPVGNIQIKVKDKTDHNFVPDQREYSDYVGKPRHENFGNTPMDNYGKDYREIVIQSGPIPNDKSPYVQGSHFDEPNVIGFTRVADYQNANGQTVSVIQELQTDLLTTVNNEQKRLDAMIKRAKKKTEEQNAILNNPLSDSYDKEMAQRKLEGIQQDMGGKSIEELENTTVLKPFPTNVGRERIPQFQTQLSSLQDQIDKVLRTNDPERMMIIDSIVQDQKKLFQDLSSMNRELTYSDNLKGVNVPDVGDNDITRQLADYVESGGRSGRELKTFPPVPFSKPGDYVDLLLKASIKDAQNRGITKIAIMPADVGANKRWSKTGDAAKRFTDLYDKKAVQELKNIKKKYPGAEIRIENIIDPSKGASNFFGKRIKADGTFEELTSDMVDEVPAISFSKGIDSREVQEDIADLFGSYGDVPAFVTFKQDDGSEIIQKIVQAEDSSFKLSDDYTTEDLRTAQFMFDEFNPGSTPMYVIDISTSSANTGPMYLYRKKEGGTIDKDRLVSITDIYGSYGR